MEALVVQIGAGAFDAGGVVETPGGDGDSPAASGELDERLDPNSDAAIVRDCLSGSPDRFRELVSRYTRMIAVFAFSRLGSREAADEVAQEAMVRAYESLPSLRVPRSFPNWLMAIANNIILRTLNESKRSIPLDATPDGAGRSVPARAGPAGEPSDELSRTELWQRILAQVNELPPRYSTVVALKHQAGLSCREIAERLGLPVGTVTGRLSRAYSILRGRIGTDGLD